MARHTPGPWEAVLDGDPRGQPVCYYRGLIALVERGKRTLAVVLGPGHPYDSVPEEQWEPNAKLIAAAPALADALELLLTEVNASGNGNARDFGWPKAVRASVDALRAAGRL